MRKLLAAWCGTLLMLSTSLASAAGIQGDYVEARTADVFTGPCISNAEVFITGSQAVMAWLQLRGQTPHAFGMGFSRMIIQLMPNLSRSWPKR